MQICFSVDSLNGNPFGVFLEIDIQTWPLFNLLIKLGQIFWQGPKIHSTWSTVECVLLMYLQIHEDFSCEFYVQYKLVVF